MWKCWKSFKTVNGLHLFSRFSFILFQNTSECHFISHQCECFFAGWYVTHFMVITIKQYFVRLLFIVVTFPQLDKQQQTAGKLKTFFQKIVHNSFSAVLSTDNKKWKHFTERFCFKKHLKHASNVPLHMVRVVSFVFWFRLQLTTKIKHFFFIITIFFPSFFSYPFFTRTCGKLVLCHMEKTSSSIRSIRARNWAEKCPLIINDS